MDSKPTHGSHTVGVGGNPYPKQPGKAAKPMQAPGDASKNHSSKMSWTGTKK